MSNNRHIRREAYGNPPTGCRFIFAPCKGNRGYCRITPTRLNNSDMDPEAVIKTVCGMDGALESTGMYGRRILITASGSIIP